MYQIISNLPSAFPAISEQAILFSVQASENLDCLEDRLYLWGKGKEDDILWQIMPIFMMYDGIIEKIE